MIESTSLVIGPVAKKVFEFLFEKVGDKLWEKLQRDPVKKAFKIALGRAINRYVTADQVGVAVPLLQDKGFLVENEIAAELAELLRFERNPDTNLIGERWKAAIMHPPQDLDFAKESEVLLDYLKQELLNTETFRPVFDTKSLDKIAHTSAVSNQSLFEIESLLRELADLLKTRFGETRNIFLNTEIPVRVKIRDHSRLIEEKTCGFVGREFVFRQIKTFIDQNPRGYFFVRGDPGIGKSALVAQLVKKHSYFHHFNIRAQGVNKPENFLENICAQLIVAYDLPYKIIPLVATQDSDFLNHLLSMVSNKISHEDKVIIIVDALDEVNHVGLPQGVNILYLPNTLPNGIYIVATSRKEDVTLRIDCEQDSLFIEQDSKGNLSDIEEYIKGALKKERIQAYFKSQGVSEDRFISHLISKSQGNFMYLHYVLPEIETGAYKDLEFNFLPVGLMNYYEDHWRRMRRQSTEDWFKYCLPIVTALTVVREPVSIDLIADFSGIKDRPRIRAVLQDWSQFLYEEKIEGDRIIDKRYRIYHESFHEFITKKEQVKDEQVNLKEAYKKIADNLWGELFGDE